MPSRPTRRRRTMLTAIALIALAVFAASCTPSDSNPTTTRADSTTSSTAADSSTSSSTTSATSVPGPDLAMAVPETCRISPECAPGMRAVYGVELVDQTVPTPVDDILTGIADGTFNAGVTLSNEPLLDSDDIVILDDDQNMIGPGNLVPILRQDAASDVHEDLATAINEISAALDNTELHDATAQVEAGADASDVATAWAAEASRTNVSVEGNPALTIGALDSTEGIVVAQLYGAGLREAGFDVSVAQLDGSRNTAIEAVTFSDIDLFVDAIAPLTDFLSGLRGAASDVLREDLESLAEHLDPRDLEALTPSPATIETVYVTSAAFTEATGIRTISQLAALLPAATAEQRDAEAVLSVGSGPNDPGVGASGEAVLEVQLRLTELGFDAGPADGVFGEDTRRAVALFQTSQDLAPDGVVGPATQAALADPKPFPESATVFPDPPAAGTGGGSAPDTSSSTGKGATTNAGAGVVIRHGDPAGDTVYLTFDDGPNANNTPIVLDLLSKYGAVGTFFVVGQNVEKNASIIQDAIARGNHVVNHTWDHPDLRKVDRAEFAHQIEDTNDVIQQVTGSRPNCVRPPYGGINDQDKQWAAEEGVSLMLWSVDPQDWRRPGTSVIVDNVFKYSEPGSIILMHDGGGDRSQTIAALEQILIEFNSRGYRYGTLCN